MKFDIKQEDEKRRFRALEILKIKNSIFQDTNNKNTYAVLSSEKTEKEKEKTYYIVYQKLDNSFICQCRDYIYCSTHNENHRCKHIHAIIETKRFKKTNVEKLNNEIMEIK